MTVEAPKSLTLYPSLSWISFFLVARAVAAPAPTAPAPIAAAAAVFLCLFLTLNRLADGDTTWSDRSWAVFLSATKFTGADFDVAVRTIGLPVGRRNLLLVVACALSVLWMMTAITRHSRKRNLIIRGGTCDEKANDVGRLE